MTTHSPGFDQYRETGKVSLIFCSLMRLCKCFLHVGNIPTLTYNWVRIAVVRRVWRYQKDNQNPYIEEEQTTQWPKEKVQKGKQRSTKHTYKTKDRVIRTPLKTGGELRCSGKVSSSYSTSGNRRVNLVTNAMSFSWTLLMSIIYLFFATNLNMSSLDFSNSIIMMIYSSK
jgi:hypothetical protein